MLEEGPGTEQRKSSGFDFTNRIPEGYSPTPEIDPHVPSTGAAAVEAGESPSGAPFDAIDTANVTSLLGDVVNDYTSRLSSHSTVIRATDSGGPSRAFSPEQRHLEDVSDVDG